MDADIRTGSSVRIGALATAILALAVGLAPSEPARADSGTKIEKQIKAFSKRLDELKKRDEWGITEEDRKRARKQLEDANVLLAKGATDQASWRVQQVEDRIVLIEKLIVARELRKKAESQQEKYTRLKEEEIPKLKKDIEELQKTKTKLRDKLGELE